MNYKNETPGGLGGTHPGVNELQVNHNTKLSSLVRDGEVEPPLLTEFFDALHGVGSKIRLCAYYKNKSKPDEKKDGKEAKGTLREVLKQSNGWDVDQGYGIYTNINTIPIEQARNGENVISINAFLLDFDGTPHEPFLEILKEVGIPPNIIVETSEGKFHFYILVEDCPIKDFIPMQKWLAKEAGSDPAVAKLPQVARVPFFYNMKEPEKPFQSRIIGKINPLRYKYEEIKEALDIILEAERPSLNSTEPNSQALGLSIDEMKAYLDHVDPEGMDYDGWLQVGMAICHETGGSDEGYELWDKWSECSEKHNNTEMPGKWESFKKPRGGRPITFRTVRNMAGCIYSHPSRRPLNDAGNAERLVDRHGQDLMFCPDWEKWLIWNGSYWEIDKSDQVRGYAIDTARNIINEAEDTNNE